MRNFVKVYDFLLHNQQLHTRVAEFYRHLSARPANGERVNMLLEILARHEARLATNLAEYINKTSAKVLDTFFQYDRQQHNIEELFTTEFVQQGLSCDEVEKIANRIKRYFYDWYESMQEAVDIETVQELFENLRHYMEEEKKRLSIDLNSLNDL